MARIVIELNPLVCVSEVVKMVEKIKKQLEDEHPNAWKNIHLEV